MTRPLIANSQRQNEANAFHRAVVKAHGKTCYFCGKTPPQVDAMHIVPRSQLGKHRYACAVVNGRPGCRSCHNKQEAGELQFKIADRRRAVKALNKVLRTLLAEPV